MPAFLPAPSVGKHSCATNAQDALDAKTSGEPSRRRLAARTGKDHSTVGRAWMDAPGPRFRSRPLMPERKRYVTMPR